MFKRFLWALNMVYLSWSCTALAQDLPWMSQTNPDIPPGILEPTRPTLPSLPTTPPSLPPSLPPLIPTPEINPTSIPGLDVNVKIKRVEVLGSTVFSGTQLQAVVAPFIGQNASFEELLAIRTAITGLYTDNGYTTSGAFLPSQDITNGVVSIQVVEGSIERIDIQGLERLQEDYVRSRIQLATQTPVNLRRLEEALQLLQLDPVLDQIQAELSAGTIAGTSVLTLQLTEAKPWTSAVTIENRDSPSVGSLGGAVRVENRNLLGLGDRLSAEYSITEGVDQYGLSYEIPLNPRDGKLRLSYNHSDSEIVEDPFSVLDINSHSETFSVGFRQPIVHKPTSDFALSLSLDLRQSQTFVLEDIPFSFSLGPEDGESKVTVLRFSQDWVNRSTDRVLAARSQFSFGLDAFDATINDTGIDGRFMSWVGQFQWVQALGADSIIIARAGAQLSNDSLLPLEQFSIGGIDTVRGYRQNQRVADNGIIGSVEIRLPIIHQPEGIGTVQIAPFFDIGTVWNHEDEGTSPNTLTSIGIGLLWQRDPSWSAQLYWGIPLNSVEDEGGSLQDHGITFSILFQPF